MKTKMKTKRTRYQLLKFGRGCLYNKKTNEYCVLGAVGLACGIKVGSDNWSAGDILRIAQNKFKFKTSLSHIDITCLMNDDEKWKQVNNWLHRCNLWNKVKKYASNAKELGFVK